MKRIDELREHSNEQLLERPQDLTAVNVGLIVKALRYYAKNHSRERGQVKNELENWVEEGSD